MSFCEVCIKDSVPKNRPSFPIVGIGASAGGLDSFSKLLKAIPEKTGMAFVIIQHLDPNHDSFLTEALSKTTKMPVHEIVHGLKLEPNNVYVLSSKVDLEINECELHIIERQHTAGHLHMPINTFFKSLAKHCERRSIGVVLTGNGNDGTEGLRAIKNEGGFTLVQDPKEAKNHSMPQSAILAGVVDFTLGLSGLAEELTQLSKHPYYFIKDTDPYISEADEEIFEKILVLIRSKQNVDFTEYKDATVKRRLVRRLALLRVENLNDYYTYLTETEDEPKALVEDVLIHVTSFFRDPEAFKKLQEIVFPQICKNKQTNSPTRMWVAGCSSGEEVYSLAMAFLEFMGPEIPKSPVQIFGSDISDRMIEKCRSGFYPDVLAKSIGPERLKRFFLKVDNGYRINKVVRDMCVFVKHDLARDPPFSRLDLITCRNVLIYFDKPLQKRLLSTFHYCLRQPGFLMLGRTENVSGHQHFFSTEDKVNKIFSRTPIQSQLRFQMPKENQVVSQMPPQVIAHEAEPPQDLYRTIDNIMINEYAPCGVLINERMEILQYRGRTSQYLEQPPGEPEANLLKVVREGLFVELQITFNKVKKEMLTARSGPVQVKFNDITIPCRIVIRPVTASTFKEPLFLVLFEELKSSELSHPAKRFFSFLPNKKNAAEELRSTKLEKELEVTKDYLQSLNDEHQKTNDALATANEEFVSGNEELQSMNEELETAKEELQSINEELSTVNDELQNSNLEVGQVNNDLINLLNSVEIPIVILDQNHRIRRFTPHARSLMNLLATDIGRSIDDIKLHVSVTDLTAQIIKATNNDSVLESEVKDKEGKWYKMQIRPYKTQDNKIEGSVISLFDIDLIRQEANKAEWARDYAASIVEGIQIPLVVLNKHLRVISANRAFYTLFNVTTLDTEKNLLNTLGINEWDLPSLGGSLSDILTKNVLFKNVEVQRDFPNLGQRTISISAQYIDFNAKVSNLILLAMEDITERKDQEIEKTKLLLAALKAKKEAEEAGKQLRLIADSVPIHLIHMDRNEKFLFVNKSAADMWGKQTEDMVGKSISEIAGAEIQQSLHKYTEKVLSGETVSYEAPFTGPNGASLTFLNTYSPDQNKDGSINSFVATGTDITERIKNEKMLNATINSLAEERELRERFVAALSHDLRTPLTVARLGAEMLGRKVLDPVQLHNISNKIVRNMERADSMIRDLLDANRLNAGEKLHFDMKECDLYQVAAEVVDDLKTSFNKEILLNEETHIKGFWDRGAIKRIIENLVSNGLKYGSSETQVSITLIENTSHAEIHVHNFGNVIDEEEQKDIFGSFKRTKSATTGIQEGWGIGLSLVKGLAEALGGSARLTSTVSEGTTFTISIPLDSREVNQ